MIGRIEARRPGRLVNQMAEVAPLQAVPACAPVSEPRLPTPLTELVGRAAELAQLRDLVAHPAVRLITLTGPGGAGKTRLAVQIAHELSPRLRGEVAFVGLSSIHDPELVLPAIGASLGVPNSGDAADCCPLLDRIAERLAGSRFLLVLDNFEQVIAGASVVSELLATCPELEILVTSREVLRVYGEHELSVPPLRLPAADADDLDALAASEAVQLFVTCASAVRLGFTLDADNAAAIATLCARLDGLPLAIELAAARMRHLSPQALLKRLSYRLPILTHGARDLPMRLRTMRDAIAWSHDLLSPEEQRLFQRLSVFHGGFALDAAEAVVGDGSWVMGNGGNGSLPSPIPHHPSPSVFDGIASLVDKSLLVAPATDDEQRYHMLETIREFAAEQLDASGEGDAVRRALVRWSVMAAECAAAGFTGPNRVAFARRLDREQPNLRQVIHWAETIGDATTALRLVAALAPYWEMQGSLREGEEWTRRCLAIPGAQASPLFGPALCGAAAIAYRRAKYEEAATHANAALEIAIRTGDAELHAGVLLVLGNIAFDRGELQASLDRYRDAAAKFREAGDEEGVADALAKQGLVLTNLDQLAEAAEALEEAVAIGRRLHRPIWCAIANGRLAFVDQRRGDYVSAEQRIAEVLPVLRDLHPIQAVAMLWLGASIARDAENYPLAAYRYRESLELRWRWGERRGVAEAVAGIAELAVRTGQVADGVRLYGGLDAMRRIVGAPGYRSEQACRDKALALARRGLSAQDFERIYADGRGMTREATVTLALALAAHVQVRSAAPLPVPVGTAAEAIDLPISPRELEVLQLAATGLSDREIGEALFISPRTVARHLHSIYRKLEVNSRAGAAAYAHRNGLLASRNS